MRRIRQLIGLLLCTEAKRLFYALMLFAVLVTLFFNIGLLSRRFFLIEVFAVIGVLSFLFKLLPYLILRGKRSVITEAKPSAKLRKKLNFTLILVFCCIVLVAYLVSNRISP